MPTWSRSRGARLVAWLVAAALPWLAGCSHDVSLPDPPSPEETPPPKPKLLGPQSGIYRISQLAPIARPNLFPVAARSDTIALMQLPDPEGGARELFVGYVPGTSSFELVMGMLETRLESEQERRVIALWGLSDSPAGAAGQPVLTGALSPGGGAMYLQGPRASVCPGGAVGQWLLERACSFDDGISGIYEGHRADGSCDASEGTPVTVALGFRGTTVVGMQWPDVAGDETLSSAWLFGGFYSRSIGAGAAWGATSGNRAGAGPLQLGERDGRVEASLSLYPGCDARGGCSGGGSCVEGQCREEACVASFSVSRLAGAPDEACDVPESDLQLRTEAALVEQDGSRFVEVRLKTVVGSLPVGPAVTTAYLVTPGEAGGAGEAQEANEAQRGPSGYPRFPLPAAADGAGYELWGVWLSEQGSVLATPICFEDRAP